MLRADSLSRWVLCRRALNSSSDSPGSSVSSTPLAPTTRAYIERRKPVDYAIYTRYRRKLEMH